jgi:hypothetical protein
VAEARGLVAGASRILTALDGVPAGVVPKTVAAGGAPRARRTGSLWTTLHLTPARAAAAAVVVLAAGTALVLSDAPRAARSAITLANYPLDSAVTTQPATPLSRPLAADSVANTSLAAPTRGRPSSRVVATEAAPQRVTTSGRPAAAGDKAMAAVGGVGAARAEKVRPARAEELAASDATRRAGFVDSIGTKKESAMARSALADNAVRGAAAGAVPRAAAAAPPSAVTERVGAAKVLAEARSTTAGCYAVTADSALALPSRLWLDSSLVAQSATSQERSIERHGVSEIVSDARRSIPGASWAPRGDGSIRLSLPAIALDVDLLPASASTLVGATAVGNRSVSVTLRRVECGQ